MLAALKEQICTSGCVARSISIGSMRSPLPLWRMRMDGRLSCCGETFATTGKIDRLRTLTLAKDWRPIVVAEGGGVVLAESKGSFILSDPDLINTHGVSDKATAKAGLKLLAVARG